MKFENLLDEINSFGPFQIATAIILYSPRAVFASYLLLNNFIGEVPPHHCDISTLDHGLFRNLTEEQKLTVSVPAGEDGSPKSCEMFAEPQFQLLANISNSTDLPTVQCQSGWIYDNSTFSSTIATEWDLVCDRKSLTKTSSTIFLVGVMVGAIICGYLSDKYGRRPTLLASYIITIAFGFSSAFSNSFILFAVLRFFTGVGLTGIDIISIVLSTEWIGTGRRSFGVVASLTWSVGVMMLAGFAFLIKDWRTLIMAVTAPLGVAVLSWWWIPESARWLLANGKAERAQFYLDRCAKFNKRPKLSSDLILETLSDMKIMEQQNKSYTYLDLIKTPKMRWLTLVAGILWFGVCLTYYGISFNITGFGLNMYLTQFIYAAIEVPAKLMTYVFIDKIGRRWFHVGTQLLTGLCIAVNIFVPKGLWYVRVAVSTLGKGLSEASFTGIYLYTNELYPTVLRQNGLSYNFIMSCLGTSVAPLMLLLEDVWGPLPQVVFCSIAFVCGLMFLLLPETKNTNLPETVDDIEQPSQEESRGEASEKPFADLRLGSPSGKQEGPLVDFKDSANEGLIWNSDRFDPAIKKHEENSYIL